MVAAAKYKLDCSYNLNKRLHEIKGSGEVEEYELSNMRVVEQSKLSDGMHMLFGFDNVHLL